MKTINNQVTLIGNIGTNVFITNLKKGVKVARFSFASHEKRRDGSRSTIWHSVFAWGQCAKFLEEYVKKGQKLVLQGRLVNRSYIDKLGRQSRKVEVEVQHVHTV